MPAAADSRVGRTDNELHSVWGPNMILQSFQVRKYENVRCSGEVQVAPQRFLRGEGGGVALESALTLAVLVTAFAGLMYIVGTLYADDRMGRGARAVARALALNPSADPWAALEAELDMSVQCPAWTATTTSADCGGWTLRVNNGVSTAALPNTLSAEIAADGGELVIVRLERAGADTTALGLARREPED